MAILFYKTLALILLLCIFTNSIYGQTQAPTEKPKENQVKNETSTRNTTIQLKDTKLCEKCTCNRSTSTLDCSNKNLSTWFTQDELDALANDNDYKFQTINLAGNELKEILKFPELPNLEILNFHNNKIENITIGAFTDLYSLKTLDLSSNNLSTKALIPDVFRGRYSSTLYLPMTNLTHLNLADNNLHTFHQDVFEHFPKMEVLNISYNYFEHIDDMTRTAISALGYIQELDLSYMGLKVLPQFLFNYHKHDLKVLRLVGNNFHVLPYEALAIAVDLEVLYLDGNPLTSLGQMEKFPILSKLTELHMSNCSNLTEIGGEAFSGLRGLKKLYLSDNPKLESIHVNAFAYFKEQSLDIMYPPLEVISLKNNNLTLLQHKMLGNWSGIKEINFKNNPWDCSCDNDYLVNTLVGQIRNQTPELLNDLECHSPEEFVGIPLKNFNIKNGSKLICDYSADADINLLTGVFVGVLMTLPIAFVFFVMYRRGCFGFINNPRRFSREIIYNRANDEMM